MLHYTSMDAPSSRQILQYLLDQNTPRILDSDMSSKYQQLDSESESGSKSESESESESQGQELGVLVSSEELRDIRGVWDAVKSKGGLGGVGTVVSQFQSEVADVLRGMQVCM
jgi:hypothetical protein